MSDIFEETFKALGQIVRVIVYGVPALLMILGFIAALGGFGEQMITGNTSMINFGELLIFIGCFFYFIEIVLYYAVRRR